MSTLVAINEAREYFFTINSKDKDRVTVTMYNTEYTFIRTAKGWENASSNKNNAASGLINGVIKAMGME